MAAASADLNEELWVKVLSHLSVGDRLGRAAFVSKRLHQAAVVATDRISVSVGGGGQDDSEEDEEDCEDSDQEAEDEHVTGLDSYLLHHGRHVRHVEVTGDSKAPLMRLPCPGLLHLECFQGLLQLGQHKGRPGVLEIATGLTRLDLNKAQIVDDSSTALANLAALSNLADLRLVHVKQKGAGGRFVSLPGRMLPAGLQHLTCLHLMNVVVEDIGHASCLTQLSVLHLRPVPGCVDDSVQRVVVSGFALPSLLDLCLYGRVSLNPAVFSGAVHMTRLVLDGIELQGGAPGSSGSSGGVSSGEALLAAVSGLQVLEELKLSSLSGVVWPAPGAVYASLTASSKLCRLVVDKMPGRPNGIWRFAFPPGRVLPDLTAFKTAAGVGDVWSVEDVGALVACCPGLRELSPPTFSAAAVTALAPLHSCLKVLSVMLQGSETAVAEAMQALATLTSLCGLFCHATCDPTNPRTLHWGALLPLTCLRRLESITLYIMPYMSIVYENMAEPDERPDVWRQLQEGIAYEQRFEGEEAGEEEEEEGEEGEEDTP